MLRACLNVRDRHAIGFDRENKTAVFVLSFLFGRAFGPPLTNLLCGGMVRVSVDQFAVLSTALVAFRQMMYGRNKVTPKQPEKR